jgi:hypothetical protein
MSILCSMVGASFVTAAAEVIRRKAGIRAFGNAQVDTAQSKFGGASLYNDGSGDYIEVVNSNSFSLGTGNFTIELWWRATSRAGSYPPIITNFNDSYSADEWGLFDRHNSYSTKFMFDCYNIVNTGPILVSTTSVSNATWYHLAIVRNGTTFTLYVNGTSEATYTSSASVDSGNYKNLFLGAVNGNYSNGHTDEIRISNSARYTSNFTPSTSPFTNDDNTLLLIHADGTDAITFFEDDNGVGRSARGIIAIGNAQVDTAQSQFGGTSLLLDGTGDYLNIAPFTGIAPGTGDFTFEAWIRLPNNNVDYGIFGHDGFNGDLMIRRVNDGTLRLGRDDVAWDLTSSVLSIANTWTHIAITRTSTTARIFVNGTQVASGSNSQNYVLTNVFRIGSGANMGANDFNGWIDEVRISNTGRYTANFTPSTTPFQNDANTILLLHMDGTDASTLFRDDNGIGRSARATIANGNTQISTAQSKFSGASALFDGTGDYLIVANNDLLYWNTQPYTIEFWCRVSGFATSQLYNDPTIVGNMDPGSDADYWSFGPDNDGDLTFKYYNGSDQRVVSTGSKMSTNIWYHCAAVIDSNTIKIFLDGTQVNSAAISGTPQFSTGYGGLNIGWGRSTSLRSFNGYLDELRISNTARYTASFTAPTAPFQNDANTLLLLHMDGTNASTVFIDDNGRRPT